MAIEWGKCIVVADEANASKGDALIVRQLFLFTNTILQFLVFIQSWWNGKRWCT